ncbi:MAG: hypothetical protein QOH84_6159 [Kribbellaceae bacterium]|jgi:hypothetical protein|nr:hypothetical protein [Kribbellaceae bacterium]
MNTPQPEPRLFHLVRPTGASPAAGSSAGASAGSSIGAAGLVTVAEGVEWSDGTVTLRWRGRWPATSAWEGGIAAVLAVHGRNGTTKLRWLPTPPPGTTPEPAPPGTTPESAPTAEAAQTAGSAPAADDSGTGGSGTDGSGAGGVGPTVPWRDWQAASGLRLAAPGVDGRCVSCGLVWPCLSCGP